MFIDGADIEYLLGLMHSPVRYHEREFQQWREEKRRDVQKRTELFIRGSDFKEYWRCPRRLFWKVHDPLPPRSFLNRGTFEAIKRHEKIEAYLKSRGWKVEYAIKYERMIYGVPVPCYGHIDAFSPSGIVLDIKHNDPSVGDQLQTASYQVGVNGKAVILLYRNGFQYFHNLKRKVIRYYPRVYACIATDILPPKHPDFPHCYVSCEYFRRCGRRRHETNRSRDEWVEWFRKIEERLKQNEAG